MRCADERRGARNIAGSTQGVIIDLAKKKVVVSLRNFLRILRSLSDLKEKYTTDVFTRASLNPVVAKVFDPRDEFATAWPRKGRIQSRRHGEALVGLATPNKAPSPPHKLKRKTL